MDCLVQFAVEVVAFGAYPTGERKALKRRAYQRRFDGDAYNSRRGRVQGMESAGAGTTVRAEVPMAEMLSYGTTLTSITQGRGSFRMEMDHYEVVPALLAEKVLANAKRPNQEELEE